MNLGTVGTLGHALYPSSPVLPQGKRKKYIEGNNYPLPFIFLSLFLLSHTHIRVPPSIYAQLPPLPLQRRHRWRS